ncbi:MAG: NAD(P)-dependent oxidoreductase [Thermoanaerobaculia bacterium]|nr:NAD(P)-dependent oxidoreductase [Thermoanaerobaculia bacterium]
MKIAVTGATGFVGRHLLRRLVADGHRCRCWRRPGSDLGGFEDVAMGVEWVPGELARGDEDPLLDGCAAVVHCAFHHPGGGFRPSGAADVAAFVDRNLLGSLRLLRAARETGVRRFVFLSSCAVHSRLLDDRPLDEAHPLWPTSHYGAIKAAVEKFIHSYGLGREIEACALRPASIYGVARPVERSKWFGLVEKVVSRRREVVCEGGAKEVHVADVARAVALLLTADGVAGEAYNCFDRYVPEVEVAALAARFAGSDSRIVERPGAAMRPIETGKLEALGMEFGGERRLAETVRDLVRAAQGPRHPAGHPAE